MATTQERIQTRTRATPPSEYPMIKDAYVSVELKERALKGFRESARRSLARRGFECEDASECAHVSIAYGEGDVNFDDAQSLAFSIARAPFEVRVTGVEILEGRSTPYDYLVLTIESRGCVQNAVEAATQVLPTREFCDGFKSHVSVLRFKKGKMSQLSKTAAKDWLRSQIRRGGLPSKACLSLEGERVCVFTSDREKCIQVPFFRAKPLVRIWAA